MSTLLRGVSSVLAKSTKSQGSAAAAVAFASCLAIASSQLSKDDEENKKTQGIGNNLQEEKPKVPSQYSQWKFPLPSIQLLPLPPTCHCEQQKPRKVSVRTLQRRRTMLRMDLSSTKDSTLDFRYYINWNAPPLGEGAFGDVYLAHHRSSNEKVALKKITKKHTDEACFQREMRALLYIRNNDGHPNICALRENFDEQGYYYLILDLVNGGEMFDHLIRNGAYSEADAARLVSEVASAMAFLHGIGVIHADLKPENLMLSTENASDAVIKLVDFGCAEVLDDEAEDDAVKQEGLNPDVRVGITPAYSPPESFEEGHSIEPALDMWSLGVILYIMLTGVHPFDLSGHATDEEVEALIKDPNTPPPIRDSPYTEYLSESSLDLIEKLMHRDPKKRLTAQQMLDHPWVRGETATTDIIAGSDDRLKNFRVFKSKIQAKFFRDVVEWSDDKDETRRKTSLIEHSFRVLDKKGSGMLSVSDLGQNLDNNKGTSSSNSTDNEQNTDESASLSLAGFQGLLSENMKNKHFPKGHVVYREGDIGNHMYFINSGSIEVTTKDGTRAKRNQGDFFGEGALLHPERIRSATIQCNTPLHAIEISREYFEKYVASSENSLLLTLREKDKIRKRNRVKTILRLQKNLKEKEYSKGDCLFQIGEDGDSLFILESGKVDVLLQDKHVFTVAPGNICGEYSLLTGRKRNALAICVSDGGCIAHEMAGRDVQKLMDNSPFFNSSLRDLNQRRNFKKAVVVRLNKQFPYKNPQEAFDAADTNKSGRIDVAAVRHLMREMDPNFTDDEIDDMVKSMDLDNSGSVTFDAFKKVFVGDLRTAASM